MMNMIKYNVPPATIRHARERGWLPRWCSGRTLRTWQHSVLQRCGQSTCTSGICQSTSDSNPVLGQQNISRLSLHSLTRSRINSRRFIWNGILSKRLYWPIVVANWCTLSGGLYSMKILLTCIPIEWLCSVMIVLSDASIHESLHILLIILRSECYVFRLLCDSFFTGYYSPPFEIKDYVHVCGV